MADIRSVTGSNNGGYLSGALIEKFVMPLGTNPTVTVSSYHIKSVNDIFTVQAQGDAAANGSFSIGAIVLAKDGAPNSGKIAKGSVVVKFYGTLAANLNCALVIDTIQGVDRPVYQPKRYQT